MDKPERGSHKEKKNSAAAPCLAGVSARQRTPQLIRTNALEPRNTRNTQKIAGSLSDGLGRNATHREYPQASPLKRQEPISR